MSGTALLGRFDDLRATIPPATASSKKRVSTGKTNISRSSAANRSQADADGNETRRPKTTSFSKPSVDLRRTGSESKSPPKTASSGNARTSPRSVILPSREGKGTVGQLSQTEEHSKNASKAGIFERSNSQRLRLGSPVESNSQHLKLASPVENPTARVVQAFNRDASLVKFVDEVRKADTRCEGAPTIPYLVTLTLYPNPDKNAYSPVRRCFGRIAVEGRHGIDDDERECFRDFEAL